MENTTPSNEALIHEVVSTYGFPIEDVEAAITILEQVHGIGNVTAHAILNQVLDGNPQLDTGGAVIPVKCNHTTEANLMVNPLRQSLVSPLTSHCAVCMTNQELWVCMHCDRVFCGRYQKRHAFLHYEMSNVHYLSLSLSDMSVWCYRCDRYILVTPDMMSKINAYGLSTTTTNEAQTDNTNRGDLKPTPPVMPTRSLGIVSVHPSTLGGQNRPQWRSGPWFSCTIRPDSSLLRLDHVLGNDGSPIIIGHSGVLDFVEAIERDYQLSEAAPPSLFSKMASDGDDDVYDNNISGRHVMETTLTPPPSDDSNLLASLQPAMNDLASVVDVPVDSLVRKSRKGVAMLASLSQQGSDPPPPPNISHSNIWL